MFTKKLIKKIKQERNKRHISQLELALQADLDKTTIWRIESGKTSPTIESLEKIAEALGMDFAALTDVSKVDL